MEAQVKIEANGEPRVLRPLERRIASPLTTADSVFYARACLRGNVDELEVLSYAAFVRHVLADVRDLP